MNSLNVFLIPYTISNLAALGLLWLCWVKPRVGLTVFGIIFIPAGIFNFYSAIQSPEVYQGFATGVLFDFYARFIRGFFKEHASVLVKLIASGQIFAGILLFQQNRALRLIGTGGGILFLLSIAPLGTGSAFPATLIMAVALFIGYKKSIATALEKNT